MNENRQDWEGTVPDEASKSYGPLQFGLWTLGILLFCILSALAVSFVFEFRNIGTRGHWNWKSAIRSMRTINAAQALFIKRNPKKSYGTLEELGADAYIDDVLSSGSKQGYSFEMVQRIEKGKQQYWVKASPVAPPRLDGEVFFLDQRNERFFFTNELGVIYQTFSDFEPGFFRLGDLPAGLHRLDGF
ncbi:MAG: hypothetical protein P1V97_29800 [Planctomycetota bacterium]|nr:hypothetical protein [Planctomycetota bacterium]